MVPPLNMVHQVVNLVMEQGVSAIIVAPFWEAQPWWPVLHSITVDSRLIPHMHCQAGPLEKVEPLQNSEWKMFAFRVEGVLAGMSCNQG